MPTAPIYLKPINTNIHGNIQEVCKTMTKWSLFYRNPKMSGNPNYNSIINSVCQNHKQRLYFLVH